MIPNISEKITSRNNLKIKQAASLSDRKNRCKLGRFAFEGRKLLEEAIKENVSLTDVFVTERAFDSIKNFTIPCPITMVSDEVYEKISFEKSPEGIFCVAKPLDKFHNIYIIYRKEDFCKGSIFLLDSIQDPGNLGTVLRTASAFGCECVIMSDDCADIYNSKTVRASMGAVFRQKTVKVKDMVGTVKELQAAGRTVCAAALDKSSRSLFDINADENVCFIVGNEGNGIRKEIIGAASGTVIIPMEQNTESLNAASAATILLYEQYRNKTKTKGS